MWFFMRWLGGFFKHRECEKTGSKLTLVALKRKELPSRVRSPAFLMEKVMVRINLEQLDVETWTPITLDSVLRIPTVDQQFREVMECYEKENIMQVKYIRDKEKAKKKIEEVLKKYEEKDIIKYAYVEKVKIRNRFTKQDQVLRDIYVVSTGENSNKPLAILAVDDGKDYYILHEDITHWNMDISVNRYTLPGGEHIWYHTFCNTVLMAHIWKNPEHASKFLVGTLSEGNPNDRYRTPNSVAVDMKIEPVLANNGQFMNNKCTLRQILLRRFDTDKLSRTEQIMLKEKEKELSDKNKCFAKVAHPNQFPLQFYWDIVNKKDIGKKYIDNGYYRAYTLEDIGEIGEIPREQKTVCCIGCGSAGSNIMEQIVRTEYMPSCLLIDFDRVEKKNLRNQVYTTGQIGGLKTSSLQSVLYNRNNYTIIDTIDSRYEDIDFSIYKFKYLISGFDSIECRLGVLELIKNKTIETQYLIDARYDELNSSLYFIDTSNEKELEYYEKLLKADKEEFDNNTEAKPKESVTWTLDEAEQWAQANAINGSCRTAAKKIGLDQGQDERICDHILGDRAGDFTCASNVCIKCIQQALERQKVSHEIEENSCQHVNIIHIYKLTSAWVLSVLRGIETDEKKPVTHVEITADPIPNAVVIRK